MGAAGKVAQHVARVGVVARLAEGAAVEVDDRVGADREPRRRRRPFDLAARMQKSRLAWTAAGQRLFVVGRTDDLDIEPER